MCELDFGPLNPMWKEKKVIKKITCDEYKCAVTILAK